MPAPRVCACHRPLVRSSEIEDRLNVVDAFKVSPWVAGLLQAALQAPPDIERLLPRAARAIAAAAAAMAKVCGVLTCPPGSSQTETPQGAESESASGSPHLDPKTHLTPLGLPAPT